MFAGSSESQDSFVTCELNEKHTPTPHTLTVKLFSSGSIYVDEYFSLLFACLFFVLLFYIEHRFSICHTRLHVSICASKQWLHDRTNNEMMAEKKTL